MTEASTPTPVSASRGLSLLAGTCIPLSQHLGSVPAFRGLPPALGAPLAHSLPLQGLRLDLALPGWPAQVILWGLVTRLEGSEFEFQHLPRAPSPRHVPCALSLGLPRVQQSRRAPSTCGESREPQCGSVARRPRGPAGSGPAGAACSQGCSSCVHTRAHARACCHLTICYPRTLAGPLLAGPLCRKGGGHLSPVRQRLCSATRGQCSPRGPGA